MSTVRNRLGPGLSSGQGEEKADEKAEEKAGEEGAGEGKSAADEELSAARMRFPCRSPQSSRAVKKQEARRLLRRFCLLAQGGRASPSVRRVCALACLAGAKAGCFGQPHRPSQVDRTLFEAARRQYSLSPAHVPLR